VTTRADWIRVELSADEVAEAERIAQIRDRECVGWTPNTGTGGIDNHRVGALGEIAACQFFGVTHPLTGRDASYVHEIARGWDVAGYEIRARRQEWQGIALRPSDADRDPALKVVLALTHAAPVIWLAGWLTLGEALTVGEIKAVRGHAINFADQAHLRPLKPAPVVKLALTLGQRADLTGRQLSGKTHCAVAGCQSMAVYAGIRCPAHWGLA